MRPGDKRRGTIAGLSISCCQCLPGFGTPTEAIRRRVIAHNGQRPVAINRDNRRRFGLKRSKMPSPNPIDAAAPLPFVASTLSSATNWLNHLHPSMATKSGTNRRQHHRAILLAALVALVLVLLCLTVYQQLWIWRISSSFPSFSKSTACGEEGEVPKRVKRSAHGQRNSAPLEYSMVGSPPPQNSEKHPEAILTLGQSEVPGDSTAAVSFPLFAQFSASALRNVCLQRFAAEFGDSCTSKSEKKSTKEDEDVNSTKMRADRKRKKQTMAKQRACRPPHSVGPAQLVSHRLHGTGSAMRQGNSWFLTEYRTGYTLFQFDLPTNQTTILAEESWRKRRQEEQEEDDHRQQLLAFPTRIHTLAEPFRGTDHTVGGPPGDETFFYELASSEGRIQALHLRSGRRLSKLVYAARDGPLYGLAPPAEEDSQKASSVDFEFDQSALWLLFRRPNVLLAPALPGLPSLSVLKLAPDSLKELGSWQLDGADPGQWVNAFVACGVLYKVELATRKNSSNGQQQQNDFSAPEHHRALRIAPVFNFHTGKHLPDVAVPSQQSWLTSNPRGISNVQFDAESNSLTTFDGGKVFSIPWYRKRSGKMM